MPSNDINIKDLGEIDQINNGDLLIVETPNGTNTLDFTNFVVGPENVSFYSSFQSLCTGVLSLSTTVDQLSAGIYPQINTTGISAARLELYSLPENDDKFPSFFIGERSLVDGLTGYITYYNEIDNNLRMYTLFNASTASVFTIGRSGSLALTNTLSALSGITTFGDVSGFGGGMTYFEGRLAVRSGGNRDGIVINGGSSGSTGWVVNVIPTTLTNTRTLTLPDATTTVVGTDTTQTLTNKTITGMLVGNNNATTDTDITVDAATTTTFSHIASFTTTRNLIISNLVAGRFVIVYLRNTNGTARLINVTASSTAAGHAAVNLAGNFVGANAAGQVSASGVTLAATTGTAMVIVMNAGGNVVGAVI